jgi:hypothetical protein
VAPSGLILYERSLLTDLSSILAAKHGLGMHLKDLTPNDVRKTIQVNMNSQKKKKKKNKTTKITDHCLGKLGQ